jgi:hypothetical protein
LICIAVMSLCCGQAARADIYKSVDSGGHVTYSSSPSKGAQRLNLAPPSSPGRPAARSAQAASPGDFPKVDERTQQTRDHLRRRILEQERATELGLLGEARNKAGRGGDPADIRLHEKNLQALDSELARLK